MSININKLVLITLASILVAGIPMVEAADLVVTDWEKTRFNELDTNKDKTLDHAEFRGTTRDWMTKADYSEEQQVKQTNKKFKQYDANKDHLVNLEEFVTTTRISNATVKANKVSISNKQVAKVPANNHADSLLQIGDIAPNYLGTDKNGNEVNVDELKGKIVVVSFWASWCQPCKDGLGILENLQNQIGPDFIKVVAIAHRFENRRSFNKYKEQLSEFNLTLTHDKRGTIGKNYGVEKAPHLFIIGKSGKIIFMDSNYQTTPVNGIVEVLKKELTK